MEPATGFASRQLVQAGRVVGVNTRQKSHLDQQINSDSRVLDRVCGAGGITARPTLGSDALIMNRNLRPAGSSIYEHAPNQTTSPHSQVLSHENQHLLE